MTHVVIRPMRNGEVKTISAGTIPAGAEVTVRCVYEPARMEDVIVLEWADGPQDAPPAEWAARGPQDDPGDVEEIRAGGRVIRRRFVPNPSPARRFGW